MKDKVVIEGLSRGGAFALNWANRDPGKIQCVYVDAPVCDFDSWPSPARKDLYADFLKQWDIKSSGGFKGNPIDNFENLAKAEFRSCWLPETRIKPFHTKITEPSTPKDSSTPAAIFAQLSREVATTIRMG